MTEAALDDAVTERVGAAIGNSQVGPLLIKELVQAQASMPFRARLAALLGSDDLVAPLRADLKPVGTWIASASSEAAADAAADTAAEE